MEKVTILSPHRDDASFSLGLALGVWSAASVKLQVLNFFTHSAYAPHLLVRTAEKVSAVRETEDRKAIAFIDQRIAIQSFGLLDAPLRLHLPLSQIMQAQTAERITQEELIQLERLISQHCVDSLVIAPLALGNHVDHMAVHRAAVNCLPPQRLAFYEDLPYLTWTSAADLQARLACVTRINNAHLESVIVQEEDAVERKRKIVSFYQSQITAEEADNIARYAESYGNGEQLWMPIGSEDWKTIRQIAIKSR